MTRLDDLERLYAEYEREPWRHRRDELNERLLSALPDLIAVARAARDFVEREGPLQVRLGERFYALSDALARLEGEKS